MEKEENIEVNVKLTEFLVRKKDGILGLCDLIFNRNFRVCDIRVMEKDGFIRLGFPSRKRPCLCGHCRVKIIPGGNYCSNCGEKLEKIELSPQEKKTLYIDMAHPMNQEYRNFLESLIVKKYNQLVSSDQALKVRRENDGSEQV